MLVQTELPHWSKHYIDSDTLPPEDIHRYLSCELDLIVNELNSHPSWVMFSNGNELVGAEGHEKLIELVERGRSLDSSRLYTDQTGFGRHARVKPRCGFPHSVLQLASSQEDIRRRYKRYNAGFCSDYSYGRLSTCRS